MMDIKEILRYAEKYRDVDPDRILLGKNDVPSELKKAVALQLELKEKVRQKLPEWADCKAYIPTKLSLEQSSSSVVARYKQRFVRPGDIIMDLTGGLGVDSTYLNMASGCRGIYCEMQEELAESAVYNFALLLDHPPKVICGDSISYIPDALVRGVSFFYVDPARRAGTGGGKEYDRKYAIEDCSPNLLELIPMMPQDGSVRVLCKLSPMLDIAHTLESVGCISQIHIVQHKGEVKELLALCRPGLESNPREVPITIADLSSDTAFRLTLEEERNAVVDMADCFEDYLYLPGGGILKAGAYDSLAIRYGIKPLHPNTHIYTSSNLEKSFPGRILKIREVIPFHNKEIKQLKKRFDSANVFSRNFPLNTNQLKSKLRIKEAESPFLIGVTAFDRECFLVLADKI